MIYLLPWSVMHTPPPKKEKKKRHQIFFAGNFHRGRCLQNLWGEASASQQESLGVIFPLALLRWNILLFFYRSTRCRILSGCYLDRSQPLFFFVPCDSHSKAGSIRCYRSHRISRWSFFSFPKTWLFVFRSPSTEFATTHEVNILFLKTRIVLKCYW